MSREGSIRPELKIKLDSSLASYSAVEGRWNDELRFHGVSGVSGVIDGVLQSRLTSLLRLVDASR